MMRVRVVVLAACAALALAACGQSATEEAEGPPPSETALADESAEAALPDAPPVADALRDAGSDGFMAIEPSELGVFPARSIAQALEPLSSPELTADGGALQISVREEGEEAIADIVRTDIPDDSVGAAHVRVVFVRDVDRWYPTNAFRRAQCRRAADPHAWSAQPCP